MQGANNFEGPPRDEAQPSAEQTLRDLLGLLALPAMWAGRDGSIVIDLMAQAIERVVHLDACYVWVPLVDGESPIEAFRLCDKEASPVERQNWADTLDAYQSLPAGTLPVVHSTPAGPMRVVRLGMGYSSGQGSVWFASKATHFPSITEFTFLRAATSLAATGLQAARAIHEREQVNRAKDEFLAMLGHELRNPLAPISTALGLMNKQRGGAPDKYLDMIERQVSLLSRLVEDLLDISRVTRGSIELNMERLRIGSVLSRAIEAASPLIERRSQTLSLNVADDGALILGDLTRLTQIFGNLLNNAAKYTDLGGHIRVSAVPSSSEVTVSVADNGAGISPDLMPRLFTIFEQGRTTIARSEGGLGIGLALVKNLVELHGGSVTASSGGVGAGSTFTVTLPVAPPSASITELLPVKQPLPAGKGIRVLLVDDNEDGLLSMEAFLVDFGFDVQTANHPTVALDRISEFKPAFAVLDIGLPDMDGFQLAKAMQERYPGQQLRLFALTGYGQPEDRRRSLDAGFERHFVKPVALPELLQALCEPPRDPYAK